MCPSHGLLATRRHLPGQRGAIGSDLWAPTAPSCSLAASGCSHLRTRGQVRNPEPSSKPVCPAALGQLSPVLRGLPVLLVSEVPLSATPLSANQRHYQDARLSGSPSCPGFNAPDFLSPWSPCPTLDFSEFLPRPPREAGPSVTPRTRLLETQPSSARRLEAPGQDSVS